MRHQAGTHLANDLPMTAARAAGFVSNPQVAWIHEADKLGRLLVERGVRADRIGGGFPKRPIARSHVGGIDLGSLVIPAVARLTTQGDRRRNMHGFDPHMTLSRLASVGLSLAGERREKH